MAEGDRVVIAPDAIGVLLDALRTRGYRILGPTVVDEAIVYAELESADELPIGWTDRQDGGTYRLERRDDDAASGTPSARIRGSSSCSRLGSGSGRPAKRPRRARDRGGAGRETPLAFFGVRSCELHAIEIQDRVSGGRFVDRDYAARREGAFIVAVNCFEPGGTCFCVSMGTGPKARQGTTSR